MHRAQLDYSEILPWQLRPQIASPFREPLRPDIAGMSSALE